MSAPAAKDPKRRAILALRYSLLFVFFSILFYWAQPFSKRVEGKTARDWFAEWSISRQCRADVIDAFGPTVVPDLLGKLTTSQRIARTWDRVFGSEPSSLDWPFRLSARKQLAIDWLAILHARGHSVIPALLADGQTNIIVSMLAYHSVADLEQMLAAETNSVLRLQIERAKAAVTRFGQGNIDRLLVSDTRMSDPERRNRRTPTKRTTTN